MTIHETLTKPRVAIMNAVHDLPVLVARDQGFFKDEGLDIEFVTTPGMAQVTTSHSVKFDSVFDRPLDAVYNEGGIDQYRMCEWGIMKRAVEADCDGLRRRKIVALGASMSSFAIVVACAIPATLRSASGRTGCRAGPGPGTGGSPRGARVPSAWVRVTY